MRAEAFRGIALSFPEAVESAHENHPDFRVGGKIFATLGYPDENWAVVKLTADQQGDFIARDPEMFEAVKRRMGPAWERSDLFASGEDRHGPQSA